MKHSILRKLMLIAVVLTSVNAFAHNFEVGGIYYNIISTSDLTVEVTYKGSYNYPGSYSGNILIPETVTNGDVTYRVTSIGQRAFDNCDDLTSVTLNNSITSIGQYAFSDCSELTSVVIPNSVTSIMWNAFENCTNLTSVTIPDGVTSIGDCAFGGCKSLASIIIPNSVTSIGYSAFGGTGWYSNQSDGVLYLDNCCLGYKGARETIEELSLKDDTRLIAGEAFKGCTSLTTATIGKNIITIGRFAFENCKTMVSITLPNTIKTIETGAFKGCSALPSITIPSSVTSIGQVAFESCSSLESVYITNLEAWCKIEFNNSSYSFDSNPLYGANLYLNNEKVTEIIIPNTVTEIKPYTFYGCVNLTSVTIPNSVTSIGDDAFAYCTGLTSVTIPESITSIGNASFRYCDKLASITIPNSVTSIGEYAFNRCSKLTSVTIPNSVERLGNYTFESCSALASVSLGNTLSKIGIYAFKGCGNITKIESMNPIAPIITETVFESKVYENAQLVVPLGASESYQSATGWSKFTNTSAGYKVTVDYSSTGGVVSVNDSNETTVSVDFDTKVDFVITPKEGFEIEKVTLNEVDITENVVDGKYSLEKLAEDVTFAVTFRKLYTIATIFNSEEGIVTINGQEKNPIQVSFDTKVDFEITPNEGYEIDKVLLNEVDITTDVVEGKYTIENATENVKLTVTFELKTFALVLKCSEAGAFKRILSYGETATYEIVPSENWEISTVTFNGTDVTTELVDNVFTTPEITEDSELSVVFVDVPTSVYSLYDTKDVKVYASQQTVKINGLEENMPVTVYDTSGHMEYNSVSTDSEMNINMNKSGAYLVKVGERTFKVIL